MALTLELKVVWPDGRSVTVRCTGVPFLDSRSEPDRVVAAYLSSIDVTSEDNLHAFLRSVTRGRDDGAVVEVSGPEPVVLLLPEILDIPGPPPRPIVVTLNPA